MAEVNEKTESLVATTVVEGKEVEGLPEDAKQVRRSHRCCGCCCDTRRAVLVINIISLCLTAFGLASLSYLDHAKNHANNYHDDHVTKSLSQIDGKLVGLSIGAYILGMICMSAGIYGAAKFNRIGVIIAGVWHALEFVLNIIFLNFVGFIKAGFFLYPHIVFVIEMNRGIMAPETYHKEQDCCSCCV